MPDLSDSCLPQLLAGRLPDLDLGREAVCPAYGGLSILNLSASVCRWLGAPDLPHPPLAVAALDDLAGGARQVILTLVDAVSFDRFRRWADGPARGLRRLAQDGLLFPVTSVVPSTTSAALVSLWTGRSPAEHGILGYELFLKEHGLVANMITLTPAALNEPGLLSRAGFQPEAALPVPTLGAHLAAAGVEAHAFLPQEICGSGLSRMHLTHTTLHGYSAPADLWGSLRALAETRLDRPRLIYAYYPEVDTLSHRWGPDSEQAESDFGTFAQTLLHRFVEAFDGACRRQTLLVILSDHGQVASTPDPHYEVHSHPDLLRRLHVLPCGESRLAYLYMRPGQTEAVAEYFERAWPGGFRMLPSDHALAAGLFGPGRPAACAADRLGDRIALAQGAAYLWSPDKANAMRGRHGGLSREEMLVPILAVRLR